MKIGILTFHFAHNYGAMLQAYSLRRFLREQGFEAEIIAYESDYFHGKYKISPLVLKKNPVKIVKNLLRYPDKKAQAQRFEQFKSEYLGVGKKRISSSEELRSATEDFDMIVVGSDQVWNAVLTNGDLTYFGESLSSSTPCASYAACMGDYLNPSERVLELIRRFSAVSVRETDALSALKDCGIDAQLCIDPVFLTDEKSWQSLSRTTTVQPQKPYILYYSLQEPQELIDKALELSSEKNLPVYMIDGRLKPRKMQGTLLKNAGPCEFLSLIKNAEYICTDSFHALAFAAIFDKKITVVHHAKTGSRTRNLLSLLGADESQSFVDCASLDKSRLIKMTADSKEYLKQLTIYN